MPAATPDKHTPKSLSLLAEELSEIAGNIRNAGEALGALGLETVIVPRKNSRVVGIQSIRAFADAARDAVRDAAHAHARGEPLSDLSAAPKNGKIPADNRGRKTTKRKRADKGESATT